MIISQIREEITLCHLILEDPKTPRERGVKDRLANLHDGIARIETLVVAVPVEELKLLLSKTTEPVPPGIAAIVKAVDQLIEQRSAKSEQPPAPTPTADVPVIQAEATLV
jgi:hypothetical protein